MSKNKNISKYFKWKLLILKFKKPFWFQNSLYFISKGKIKQQSNQNNFLKNLKQYFGLLTILKKVSLWVNPKLILKLVFKTKWIEKSFIHTILETPIRTSVVWLIVWLSCAVRRAEQSRIFLHQREEKAVLLQHFLFGPLATVLGLLHPSATHYLLSLNLVQCFWHHAPYKVEGSLFNSEEANKCLPKSWTLAPPNPIHFQQRIPNESLASLVLAPKAKAQTNRPVRPEISSVPSRDHQSKSLILGITSIILNLALQWETYSSDSQWWATCSVRCRYHHSAMLSSYHFSEQGSVAGGIIQHPVIMLTLNFMPGLKTLFTTAGFPIAVQGEAFFTSTLVGPGCADTDLLTVVVSRGTQIWHHCKKWGRLTFCWISVWKCQRELKPKSALGLCSSVCKNRVEQIFFSVFPLYKLKMNE